MPTLFGLRLCFILMILIAFDHILQFLLRPLERTHGSIHFVQTVQVMLLRPPIHSLRSFESMVCKHFGSARALLRAQRTFPIGNQQEI
jgi:hypothetical protein